MNDWDTSGLSSGLDASVISSAFRVKKQDIADRMNVEHNFGFSAASDGAHTLDSASIDHGISDPVAAANTGRLYYNTTAGRFFYYNAAWKKLRADSFVLCYLGDPTFTVPPAVVARAYANIPGLAGGADLKVTAFAPHGTGTATVSLFVNSQLLWNTSWTLMPAATTTRTLTLPSYSTPGGADATLFLTDPIYGGLTTTASLVVITVTGFSS